MAKFVVACAVVAIALFGSILADLSQGTITPGDRILFSDVRAANGTPGGLVSRVVSYTGSYNITAIRAYDRTANRTGQAHVTRGGLSQRYVDLTLQARYIGSPIDYLVEIYGR